MKGKNAKNRTGFIGLTNDILIFTIWFDAAKESFHERKFDLKLDFHLN